MCLFLSFSGIAQTTVLENFDGATAPTVSVNNAAAMTATAIVTDPSGSNGNVLEFITDAAGVPWQETQLTLQDTYVDLTPGVASSFTVDVYSTEAFDVLAKVVGGINTSTGLGVANSAADAIHSGGGWETLTFDFSAGEIQDGQAAPAGAYSKIIFFNLWNANDAGTGAGGWSCSTGNCPATTKYYDNITGVAGSGPVVGPTVGAAAPPARNATDVISFYGGNDNSYTNETGVTFDSFGGSTIDGDVTLADGQVVIKYSGHQYSGIGGGDYDISSMETLHIDYYSLNSSAVAIKFEDNAGGNQQIDLPGGALAQDQWNSIDIDLSIYPNVDFTQLFWIVPVTSGVGGITMWLDNVYFYKTLVDPNTDASLSALNVNNDPINGFSGSTLSYNYAVDYSVTDVPQITSAITTQTGASAVLTQATAIPGIATVDVTAPDGSTIQTYTINIVRTGPATAAPTPPDRAANNVVSMYSNAYTNSSNWGSIDVFGGVLSDEVIQGNDTYKLTSGFQYNYYSNGGSEDLSNMTYMHVDFYVDGDIVEGQVLGIQILDQGGTNNNFYQAAGVADSWRSVDVLMSDFTPAAGSGIYNAVKLIQVNLQGPAGAAFAPVYLDNFYFHNNDTSLGTTDLEVSKFSAYPNPTNDKWTITSTSEISNISLFDILGKQVQSLSPNNNEASIDASSLGTGIYFAKIQGVNGSKTLKLIKQ